MSPPARPWDFHPDLREERLQYVGQLLHDVRAEVADCHLPELGDDNYVLGTRGWSWCRSRLIAAAEAGEHPWLTMVDPQRPTFAIGRVPVGFYRGEPDHPNQRTLRRSELEARQYAFAFGDEDEAALTWRIATPLDFEGKPADVAFVGLNAGGQALCQWLIPIEARVPTLRPVERREDPATGVSRPQVRARTLAIKADPRG